MTVTHLDPTRQRERAVDAPIAVLQQRVKGIDLAERARQRDAELSIAATHMAHGVLAATFPDTLAPLVDAADWHGLPPLSDNDMRASAVAYLGDADGESGWWLYYTRRQDAWHGGLDHVLTLIAPCSCGAYADRELADEDTLIAILDALTTDPGAPIECDYLLPIRGNSYADTRHRNFEPPF